MPNTRLITRHYKSPSNQVGSQFDGIILGMTASFTQAGCFFWFIPPLSSHINGVFQTLDRTMAPTRGGCSARSPRYAHFLTVTAQISAFSTPGFSTPATHPIRRRSRYTMKFKRYWVLDLRLVFLWGGTRQLSRCDYACKGKG